MMSLTSIGWMLLAVVERIADMPAGTVGFQATGEIEREDYDEVLAPELQRALEAGGGLRTVYVIENLDQIEPRRAMGGREARLQSRHPPPRGLGAVGQCHRHRMDGACDQAVRVDDPRGSTYLLPRRAGPGKGLGRRRLSFVYKSANDR